MEISYQKGSIQNELIQDEINVVNRPFKKDHEQNYNSTGSQLTEDTDEESPSLEPSPLMRIQRHKAYLKYGSGPKLYKSGSMRAGPSLKNTRVTGDEKPADLKKKKALNKNQVDRLYRSTSSKAGSKLPTGKPNLVMTPGGKLLRAGSFAGN